MVDIKSKFNMLDIKVRWIGISVECFIKPDVVTHVECDSMTLNRVGCKVHHPRLGSSTVGFRVLYYMR